LLVSPTLLVYWVLAPEEIIGKKTLEFIHPDDVEKYS
jgi:hypothetical protein